MRKIYYIVCLVALFSATHTQAQVVLKALEGEIPFTPSAKCLERIKDRNYGDGEHNYIYCAVQGPNGKKWLNLNLGAEYAKEDSPYFNPEAQPVDNQDWKAFGNLFQYGRKADGHEIVTYLTDTDPDPTGYWKVNYKYSTTTEHQDAFNSNNQTVRSFEWYSNEPAALDNGWVGNMINNPCPSGYRVMNANDVYSLIPNNNQTVDLTQITSKAAPGIVRNTNYENLYMLLGPTIYYKPTWDDYTVFNTVEPDWEIGGYAVTYTRRVAADFPGTASLHLADTEAAESGYPHANASRIWSRSSCRQEGWVLVVKDLGIPGFVTRGSTLDVWCTRPLAVISQPVIAAVRCVEQ